MALLAKSTMRRSMRKCEAFRKNVFSRTGLECAYDFICHVFVMSHVIMSCKSRLDLRDVILLMDHWYLQLAS